MNKSQVIRQAQDKTLRTWIEIDTKALKRNILTFRKLIGPKVKLMAVVKSNAYGHGLLDFVRACVKCQMSDAKCSIDWYGVDSIVEAIALRKAGLKKPILVLGYTLPDRFSEAVKYKLSLTISTFENIRALKRLKRQPNIHIKIDTGMHRQGFLPNQISAVIRELKKAKLFKEVEGVYTHFAAAKDRTYPFYTNEQIKKFERAYLQFEANGFLPFLRHAAATGGTLLHPEAHYDMVRIGIGLYGLWPSREAQIQFTLPEIKNKTSPKQNKFATGRAKIKNIELRPILTWKTIVSEIKKIPAGSYVGYDLTERVVRPTRIAILPVGYWHGVDRGLSSIGNVIVKGKRAKILGRVSMDMITVDVTNIPDLKVGDVATLIGRDGDEEITAYEWAEKLSTTHYEIITRLNPLIKRIYR
jgi:alanine racemase